MLFYISGSLVTVLDRTYQADDPVEERSTCRFTVRDDAGTSHYNPGQLVKVNNDDGTTAFEGFIASARESVPGPGPLIYTAITCGDNMYRADKRRVAIGFDNTLAGDIASTLVKNYLGAEGVIGQHNTRVETTQADWQTVNGGGALSANLDATTTPGDLLVHNAAGVYDVSGQRVSPAIDLSPLGIARVAQVDWTAALNGGTLLVEASIDGGANWQTCTSGAAIPNIPLMGNAFVDGFDVDTSASYSNFHNAVINLLNSYVTVSSPTGDSGQLLYGGINASDVEVITTVDTADLFGIIFRHDGPGTRQWLFYVSDESSANGSPSTWQLIRLDTGFVYNLVASGSLPTTFIRGTVHTLRVLAQGTNVQVFFDGIRLANVVSLVVWAGEVGIDSSFTSGAPFTGRALDFFTRTYGLDLAGKSLLIRQTLSSNAGHTAAPALHDLTVTLKSWYIQDGPTIVKAPLNYVRASDALVSLGEAAVGFWVNIDHQRRLSFMPRVMQLCPVAITPGVCLAGTVRVENAKPLYVNREFALGRDVTADITETRQGDGKLTAFTFSYPLAHVPSALTVNGVAKTVGIKSVDTGKDWYWSEGDAVLAQDSAGTKLVSTDTLSMTYKGYFTTVLSTEDTAEVLNQAALEGAGTTGYVDDLLNAPITTTSAALYQLANAQLAKYAKSGRLVEFDTEVALFAPGQYAPIYLAAHGISGLMALVMSVHPYDAGGGRMRYTVKATSGPVTGTWSKLFNTIINGAVGSVDSLNIGSGSTVAVLVPSTNETWTWGESVTVTAQACPIIGPATIIGPALIIC